MRAQIEVKHWIADKINEELHQFHWVLVRESKDEDLLNPNCNYRLNLTCPILRETEKAIFVEIQAATYDDDYKEYRTWIPKSAIVERIAC